MTARLFPRPSPGRLLIYAVLALFAALYLFPALVLLSNTFRSYAEMARYGRLNLPRGFSFEPFIAAWTETCVSGTCNGIAANFFNSLRITIPATLVTTALGALNGFVLSKWRFKGANAVFALIVAGIFLPGQITLLPWAWIMGKLGLANNANGLILIHIVQGLGFTTLFCRNFYAGLPDELIKAARVDGAGFFRIFSRIILPLSPPILFVCVVWQFTGIWNEYLFGMVFTSGSEQPITAALTSVGGGRSAATVLIAALPPLLVFLAGGRYFVRGLTAGALK